MKLSVVGLPRDGFEDRFETELGGRFGQGFGNAGSVKSGAPPMMPAALFRFVCTVEAPAAFFPTSSATNVVAGGGVCTSAGRGLVCCFW